MTGLGTQGNHESVFALDGPSGKVHIIDSCLSYIHCLMSSRDKQDIRNKVCSKFSLEQLKVSRQRIYEVYDESGKKYKYNGPHSKNERDKILDAFEGIFSKMVKLDAEDKMPLFSVSSFDLLDLITVNDEKRSSDCDSKFKKIENDIQELKQTFHSFVTVITSSNKPVIPTNPLPPVVRDRLLSTASKRSASEVSDEDEDPITSFLNSDPSQPDKFILPRKQRQKLKRPKINSQADGGKTSSYSEITKKGKEKPPSTWGTAKSTAGFRGAVPEVFIYNGDITVTTDDISEWFEFQNIRIRSIEKKSHNEAQKTSFKVTPATKEDYDLILDGSHLPDGIAARRFIPPRWKPNDEKQSGQPSGHNEFRNAMNEKIVQNLASQLQIPSHNANNVDMETENAPIKT